MAELTVDHGIRLRRAAGIRSIRLGETKVSYVPDGDVRLRPVPLLQDSTDEVWAAHPEYLDSRVTWWAASAVSWWNTETAPS